MIDNPNMLVMCTQYHYLFKCSNEKLIDEGYTQGYWCDICDKNCHDEPYHCSECQYDMCLDCYNKAEKFCNKNQKLSSQERDKRRALYSLVFEFGQFICVYIKSRHIL